MEKSRVRVPAGRAGDSFSRVSFVLFRYPLHPVLPY